ncbi:Resolvase, N terminal domain [Mycobacteroides abscessus subsp. abscessus]|nr:Resolvase, N terminal domain [Mycobacteroides abscessus subsp. abscessus]
MSAVIYLRSASGNREQTTWQEADCREYLRERDLTEAGVITDTGHPGPGLAKLLDAAANGEVTDVVVSDLSRLGRTPLAHMRTFDALNHAGVTIHVASGTLSGPVLDDCIRGMMYEFATVDAQRPGCDDTQQD